MANLGGGGGLVLIGLLLRVLQASSSSSAYDNVIDDSYSVNSLTPNQFYKICPNTKRCVGGGAAPFGQPTCGDGTDFCFFFSRPAQRKENRERILIELMGGGACWDANTCNRMSSYLTFPEDLDNFLGLSCSEVQAGLDNDGDKAFNMLCAQSIGETDFTSYNSVVIPYCTQDVHIGSNVMDYSQYDDNNDDQGRRLEDSYDTTVRHMGAHNVMSTLRWVFKNFPAAKHIALTGCSAGGTGVPIVYDIVRKHYNHFGIRKVQINAITDSPVYLTPAYFLENALDNWNPWQILKRTGWNYNKFRYSEEYPTAAFDYILRKGSNRDRWGFVSHTDDPVSLTYYEYMSGNGDNNRRLDDGDMEGQWYSELTSSLDTIQAKHKNVETYWINDEGHCSFGLYYAMQNDGFADWAGSIFQESTVSMAPRPAVGAFVVALLLGIGLTAGIMLVTRKQSRSVELHVNSLMSDASLEMPGVWKTVVRQSSLALETADSAPDDKNMETPKRWCGKLKTVIVTLLSKLADCPVTAGLAISITIFFLTMIITEGFAHPLNNPSLGPSAIGLSRYGINNPTLIVSKHQWFRLVTANFLCSGVLTYLITMLYLAYTVRSLEMTLASPLQTVWLITLVALGINLLYAFMLEGATCSSVALMLGLQTCHLVLRRCRKLPNSYTFPVVFVLLVFLVSILFPFDSQWMMLASILFFGPVVGWIGLKEKPKQEESPDSSSSEKDPVDPPVMSGEYIGESMKEEDCGDRASDEQASARATEYGYTWRKEILYVYAVWFVLVALGIGLNGPNALYLEPFYTGCELYYSTDVASIAAGTYDNGGGDADRRRLDEEQDDESMCAEFCIPLVTSRFVQLGVDRLGIAASRGQCQDAGYSEHVADKTFSYLSYSLDVEVYYQSDYQ